MKQSLRQLDIMCAVCLLVVCIWGVAHAQPAATPTVDQTFRELFGDRIKQVTSSSSHEDDVQLANEMIKISESSPQTLAIKLCEEAFGLAMRNPESGETAIAAMQRLVELAPDRKDEADNKVLTLLQRQFTISRGEQRAEAGEHLLNELLRIAEQKEKEGEMVDAASLYRRAMGTANQINAPRAGDIRVRLDNTVRKQAIQRMLNDYKQRLKNDPGDMPTARALLMLYLVTLDNPAEARKYSFLVQDPQFKTLISWAASEMESLNDDQLIALGDWYLKLSDEAGDADSMATMLTRAKSYYDRYLSTHDATDIQGVKIRVAISRIDKRLDELTTTASGATRSGAWIDLLSGLDPSKTAIAGKWTIDRTGLQCEEGDASRILLPAKIPASYDMTIKFARTSGKRGLFVHLPLGSTDVALHLGDARISNVGLDTIDGKRYMDNPSTQKIAPLNNNEPYVLSISVVLAGPKATIIAALNGQRIMSWQGAASSLSSRFAEEKQQAGVIVGAHYSKVTFAEVKVRSR